MTPVRLAGPSERRRLRREMLKLHPGVALALAAAALVMQVFLPALLPAFRLVDLPLLAVVYLASTRRRILIGMLIGMAIGLAQDGLTHEPFGLFGIAKTVAGYAAGSVSLYVEMEYPGARSVMTAVFYLLHELVFWLLAAGLLGRELTVDPARALMLCAAHAGLALILFPMFDRLRQPV